MQAKRKAAVFDLGGVLIDWNPRHLYRKLFANEAEMERFLSEQDAPRPGTWSRTGGEAGGRRPRC